MINSVGNTEPYAVTNGDSRLSKIGRDFAPGHVQ